MTNLFMLAVCLLAGMPLRIARRMPENAHAVINGFIIHMALPALVLGQIHGLRLTTNLLRPVSMPWLLFALSAVMFNGLARVMRLPDSTTGALIRTAGLADTSFAGLQLRLEKLRDHRALVGLNLGFKLVLGPLLLALLYVGLLACDGEPTQVTLFESAMGPQIGSAIVALQYGLSPTLITLMVGIGIALSFLSLPLWCIATAAV
jgi:predicted permease